MKTKQVYLFLNSIVFRMAKIPWSFVHSESNGVTFSTKIYNVYVGTPNRTVSLRQV